MPLREQESTYVHAQDSPSRAEGYASLVRRNCWGGKSVCFYFLPPFPHSPLKHFGTLRISVFIKGHSDFYYAVCYLVASHMNNGNEMR